jgi:hypothetical protein
MMLIDLIRRNRSTEIATAILAIPATTQTQSDQTIAKVARIAIANQGTEKIDLSGVAVKSRWWLVQFIDRDPKEICCNPIASAAQVLNAITGAISAEPIANGSLGLTEPDKYGHWSESEVELVFLRTASFVSRGVPMNDADALACHLVERDRTFDDRRSCAECFQLARGRCRLGLQPFGGGGVEVLHRCSEFKEP